MTVMTWHASAACELMSHAIATLRGWDIIGYEARVSVSSKAIWDLAYIDNGGIIPAEPSSFLTHRQTQKAVVWVILR